MSRCMRNTKLRFFPIIGCAHGATGDLNMTPFLLQFTSIELNYKTSIELKVASYILSEIRACRILIPGVTFSQSY